MVRVRWKLTEVVVSQDGGGGNDPLPKASFESTVLSVGEEYSDTSGLLFNVTATLDKLWASQVTVPYTLTGDATYDIDYWKGQANNDATKETFINLQGGGFGSFFRFQPGQKTANHWFWIVNDSGPGAPIDEDFILTMVESITFDNDVTVSITEAELADADTVATVTIIDDDAGSGDPTVSWSVADLAVLERDSGSIEYTNVDLVLSSVNAGASVKVTIDGATTATVGPGGVGDDVNVVAAPTVYTFGGNITRNVPFTVYGDTDVEGDEYLVLTLSDPVNCALGAITTFTLTITDDDSGVHEDATVFLDPTNTTTVAEGGQLAVRVLYGGTQDPHDPFEATFAVVGQPNGPSGNAAEPDDYTVLTTSPLFFGESDFVKTVLVSTTASDGVEGNEDFRVALVSLADSGGGEAVKDEKIKLGETAEEPTSQNFTILDGDQGGGPVDGDLNDWEGNALIPERRTFDASSPHFRVSYPGDPAHGFATEAYQVLTDVVPGHVNGQWYPPSGNASTINTAMKLAEYVWRDLNSGYTDPDDAPVGIELNEVLIEVKTRAWDPSRLCDYDSTLLQPYVYDNPEGGGFHPHTIFEGSGSGVFWKAVNSSNITVRDVIVYGDGVTRQAVDCPNIPVWLLRNDEILVDNIRFERLGLIGPRFVTNKVSGGDIGTSYPDSRVRYHGRIKMYDCQVFPGAWGTGAGSGSSQGSPKWTIRVQPVSLDIRHPEQPLPWYPVYPSWEHYTYVDSPPGPDTYATLGTTGACIAYVNFKAPARNHPTHPSATFTGGSWQGPYFAAQNTVLQLTNRAMYNRDIATNDFGRASSGDVVFIRCDTSEHGAHIDNAGEAFKIGGHNGRVYVKDCKANGSSAPGLEGRQGAPLNLLVENYTVGGSSTTALGPDGAYVIDYSDADASDADRIYTQQELVIDGFDVSGNSSGKPFVSLVGVRTVKLRKFRFHDLQGGRAQFTLNYMPGSAGISSAGHIRFWDTADLVEQEIDGSDGSAHLTGFDGYAGWGAQTKMTDFYFRHWDDVRAGDFTSYSKTLTSGDIDNLPTDGPPAYTQANGLIQQQWDGWLTSASPLIDGAAGSPTWTSAYAGDGDPPFPVLDFTESTVWIGEDDATGGFERYGELRMLQSGGPQTTSGLLLQVRGTIDVSALPTATVEYTLQTPCEVPANDAPQEWAELDTSPFTFPWYPVQGLLISSDQATVGTRSDAWLSAQDPQIWDEGKITFRVRPNASGALSTGTKQLELDLLDGAERPEWETPYASGTYTQATWVGGSGQLRINVVPEADYAEDGWTSPSRTVDPGSMQNGTVYPIQIERRSAGNQDAMRLDGFSVVSVTTSVPSNAYTLNANLSWSNVGDGTTTSQVQSATLTIDDASQFGDGDTLVLTLEHTNPAQHVVADNQADLYQVYTFSFESPTPVVEWSGSTSEPLDELQSGVYAVVTSEPVTGSKTVEVQLGGTAGSSQWNSGGTNDYTVTPAPDSNGLVILTLLDGDQTASLTVDANDVDSSKTLIMQIVGGGLIIGSKDTKTVTINDVDGGGLTMGAFKERTDGKLDFMGISLERVGGGLRCWEPGEGAQQYAGGWIEPGTWRIYINSSATHSLEDGLRVGGLRSGNKLSYRVIDVGADGVNWDGGWYTGSVRYEDSSLYQEPTSTAVLCEFPADAQGGTATEGQITVQEGQVIAATYCAERSTGSTLYASDGSDGIMFYCSAGGPKPRGGLYVTETSSPVQYDTALWAKAALRIPPGLETLSIPSDWIGWGPVDSIAGKGSGTLPDPIPSDYGNYVGGGNGHNYMSERLTSWWISRSAHMAQFGPGSVDVAQFDKLFRYGLEALGFGGMQFETRGSRSFSTHGMRRYDPYLSGIVPAAIAAALNLGYTPDFEPFRRLLLAFAHNVHARTQSQSYVHSNTLSGNGNLADNREDSAWSRWLWYVCGKEAAAGGPGGFDYETNAEDMNAWNGGHRDGTFLIGMYCRDLMSLNVTSNMLSSVYKTGSRFKNPDGTFGETFSNNQHGCSWTPSGAGNGWDSFYAQTHTLGTAWARLLDWRRQSTILRYNSRSRKAFAGGPSQSTSLYDYWQVYSRGNFVGEPRDIVGSNPSPSTARLAWSVPAHYDYSGSPSVPLGTLYGATLDGYRVYRALASAFTFTNGYHDVLEAIDTVGSGVFQYDDSPSPGTYVYGVAAYRVDAHGIEWEGNISDVRTLTVT